MIYLDNSATSSIKPQPVRNAVYSAMRYYAANPGRSGHRLSIRTAEAVYRTRSAFRRFFHTRCEEDVIFTPGCTYSLNMVLKGVLRDGDHVVISSMEHNAVLRPLERMKGERRITYTVAPLGHDDDDTLDHFRHAINTRTRLIVCTGASNVFGTRLPTRRICALAHQYGIRFCLDAAQVAGITPIDMIDDGYDYVCIAGHKGLYGIEGAGALLLNSDDMLDPLVEGGTGSDSASSSMPAYYPDRLESGTLNIPGILSMGAGIRFLEMMGVERVMRREMTHIRSLYERFEQMDGVLLYTPMPDAERFVPVLSFNIRGMDSEKVAELLDRRYGIATRAGLHCAPLAHRAMGTEGLGTVRVSPSVFTTERDMKILADAVYNFQKSP